MGRKRKVGRPKGSKNKKKSQKPKILITERMVERPEGLYTSPSEESFKSLEQINYDSLEKASIEISEATMPTNLSFEDFHSEALRRAKFREKIEGESRRVEVNIPTDKPIAIAFFSDQHLGSGGVDYELVKETADLIKEHPLAYCITGGDVTDCLFFDYGEEIMNMQEQYVYMYKMLEHIGSENVIAGILGNHEAWATKRGVHNYMEFSNKTKRPLMRGISHMYLKVGDQEYKILMSHKFKGHSMYNANHPQGRVNRKIPGADVIISGHTHNPAEQSNYQDMFGGDTKKIAFITGKTFKKLDAYGKDQAFVPVSGDKLGCNWLILNNDTRMIRTASSNAEMVETMKAYVK